ncbi:MAG: TRAP transporter substrate-binding protein, partial [Burkholderiales bacterium]
FYTVTAHAMGPEIVIMSRRAWDELSSDDRTIFRAAARESANYMRKQWTILEQRTRKQAMKSGITITDTIDRKAFEAATKPLREELRADPKLGPLIRRIEAER